MRKFIHFSILMALIVFASDRILTLSFDYLYQKIKTGQTGGKINYYLSTPTPKMVIMGNSRAFYQVIPDSFKIPTYSLCHAGQTQIFQTGLLKVLQDNSKLPPVILLHVEPDEFLGNSSLNNIQNLKYYYGKEPFITKKLNELSDFESIKFSFGLYRYNGRAITLVKNFIQTKTAFRENNGYEAVMPTLRDSINTLYSANKVENNENLTFNNSLTWYLTEFISICKKERVNLICFTSPLYKVNIQDYKASLKVDSLLKGNHVPYINFLSDPITELQGHPRYWKDTEHLNHDGAKMESKILADKTQRILKNSLYN